MLVIDTLMSLVLVVSFLLIMAVIGVNVFIALLSTIVERVYEDNLASAALQHVSYFYPEQFQSRAVSIPVHIFRLSNQSVVIMITAKALLSHLSIAL